jgi:hypothetical protein
MLAFAPPGHSQRLSRSAENEKELNNLRSEIAIMRGLDHPNIIKVSPGGAALPASIPRPRVSAHSGCGPFWARAFFDDTGGMRSCSIRSKRTTNSASSRSTRRSDGHCARRLACVSLLALVLGTDQCRWAHCPAAAGSRHSRNEFHTAPSGGQSAGFAASVRRGASSQSHARICAR